ncbi:LysR family transcriptional regulator [Paenibacillus validus]|uniref:LysR family transcriptional regulator n=1 Tax=Paenibacillus TaxID=44249 RepID=UPI000FDB2E8A|nr:MULTISPECIES: LysR family transcriptional regulator [Paenibacillus]MED4603979.1 LysR family transcriptional regulator [Paenibacillus validus]MED4609501.1 LysR family transcriptional regulator [Paenibacillus validus]
MEDLNWIILKELYRQKNITKTAESLFISQPSLTNRLRQIEKEFGVLIVHRGRRGVHFTPEGEYLAKCADEMITRLRKIKDHVLNMENQVVGTLRLAVTNLITRKTLPRLLKLFKDRYPSVEFKVMTGWSKDVFHLIYNQEVHVGFVRGEYAWPGQKYLLSEEAICIASKEELQLERLPYLSRIDYQTDPLFKSLIDKWWTEHYTQPPYIGMEVDKSETCREMLLNGLGYAILPHSVLGDAEGLFKQDLLDAEGQPIVRRTWMYYHEETLELNLVRTFVEFVKALDLKEGL